MPVRIRVPATTINLSNLKKLGTMAMNVNIQTVKFDADKRLVEFIERKLAKIERFAEHADNADVVLKLDKDAERGNKVVMINVRNAGGDLMTEQRARTFEEAVDLALDVLKRQCEKLKERH